MAAADAVLAGPLFECEHGTTQAVGFGDVRYVLEAFSTTAEHTAATTVHEQQGKAASSTATGEDGTPDEGTPEGAEEPRVLLDGADHFLMQTLCEHASSALQARRHTTTLICRVVYGEGPFWRIKGAIAASSGCRVVHKPQEWGGGASLPPHLAPRWPESARRRRLDRGN